MLLEAFLAGAAWADECEGGFWPKAIGQSRPQIQRILVPLAQVTNSPKTRLLFLGYIQRGSTRHLVEQVGIDQHIMVAFQTLHIGNRILVWRRWNWP